MKTELTYDELLDLSSKAIETYGEASMKATPVAFDKDIVVKAIWDRPEQLHTHLVGLNADQIIEALEEIEANVERILEKVTDEEKYNAMSNHFVFVYGDAMNCFHHLACGLMTSIRDGGLKYGVDYENTKAWENNRPVGVPIEFVGERDCYLGNGK